MQRLRDAGNSLVVVEHDPAVMLAADRMLDMGPGPGERGGEIVFDGTPDELRSADTLTGAYLGARKQRGRASARPVTECDAAASMLARRARAQPEGHRPVEFPLSGSSASPACGSGKSTLIQDVLYPALRKPLRQAHRNARRARARSWVTS